MAAGNTLLHVSALLQAEAVWKTLTALTVPCRLNMAQEAMLKVSS